MTKISLLSNWISCNFKRNKPKIVFTAKCRDMAWLIACSVFQLKRYPFSHDIFICGFKTLVFHTSHLKLLWLRHNWIRNHYVLSTISNQTCTNKHLYMNWTSNLHRLKWMLSAIVKSITVIPLSRHKFLEIQVWPCFSRNAMHIECSVITLHYRISRNNIKALLHQHKLVRSS